MNMSLEIKNRRSSQDAKVASRETPTGKRKRGWPKHTWRRTVMKEQPGLDKVEWRSLIAALCPSRDEEDE